MTSKVDHKIENLKALRQSLINALIILTGGLSGLLLSFIDNPMKWGLLIVGIVVGYWLLMSIAKINSRVNNLIKGIEGD